jgi:DNA polymerase-3 subunit epsilon
MIRRDAIISIGFIPFDDHRIRCNGAAELDHPSPILPVAEMAVTIHGITHSDLAAAPTFWRLILKRLLQAMAGKVVVAHCHEIERRFSGSGIPGADRRTSFSFPVIDTMAH